VKGVLPQDILIGVNKPTDQLGLIVSQGHIAALGKATLNYCNETGSPITPTENETYNFVVVQ
jgi:hypothetical protein